MTDCPVSGSVIPRGINRDDRPDMRDLNRHIVEQQAAEWEKLGVELGLKDYHIANISKDNPNRSVICCRAMLHKWLDIDPSASWGKLNDAMKKTKVPSTIVPVSNVSSHSNGNTHLKDYYISTRFTVDDDIWPPVQLKHYTPLVLVHRQGHWSKQEVNAMVAANVKGHIEEYLSTTGSKTTKDLQEVFCFLDQPVSGEHPRIVLVEGAPGVGKSVLIKHISYLWANNKLLTKTDVLFLLYLRDPAVHEMKSLHDLVHHFYYHDKVAAECCMAQILKENGKPLTILLDGYDEYPYHLQQHSFIADILQRKILPACAIVVSSRPHSSTKLRSNVTCRIEILGFSEDDKEDFIQQSLEKEPDKISVLNDYLKTHPIISSLCYIPFYMTVLLFLYVQESTLPTSSTELYSLFICMTICRHLAKAGIALEEEDITDINDLLKCLPQSYKNIINKLSKFAYQALHNNQLVFTRAEIIKLCPEIYHNSTTINGFGLLQAVEYVGRINKNQSFNFLHLSIQEYLAATYVTRLSFEEEFSIFQENFWKANYLNMFTFYITLTKGQRSSFRRFLSGGDDRIAIHSKFLDDKLKCIHLYRCFNEASGDHRICRSIERKLSNGKLSFPFTTLSTNDIYSILIFLTCCSIKQWKKVDLGYCHIRDAGLKIIHRTVMQPSPITIEELWLYNNDLSSTSDGCLADIVITCGVKLLDISDNETIGQTEEFFPTILSSSDSMIEKLWIDGINLSSTATITIFTLLKEKTKLKALGMADIDISDDSCDVIAETLQVNSTLEELYIHGNKLSKEALQLILNSLRCNNTLTQLWLPSITEDGEKQIFTLQDIVNEERTHRGCQAKLNVTFF